MILIKTEAGQQAFKDRSIRLTPRQRSAFILCDGKRSRNDMVAAGMGITHDDVEQMIALGLLTTSAERAADDEPEARSTLSQPSFAGAAVSDSTPERQAERTGTMAARPDANSNRQRYQDAYAIATRLTGSLGLRGFRLNLSVESTSTYEELVALLPKIRAAVGPDKIAELERALLG